jgi:hypothetical protein
MAALVSVAFAALGQQSNVEDQVATQCRVPPLGCAGGDAELLGQSERPHGLSDRTG